jgi:hypothetical protein
VEIEMQAAGEEAMFDTKTFVYMMLNWALQIFQDHISKKQSWKISRPPPRRRLPNAAGSRAGERKVGA